MSFNPSLDKVPPLTTVGIYFFINDIFLAPKKNNIPFTIKSFSSNGRISSFVKLHQISSAKLKFPCKNNIAFNAPIEVPETTSIYLSMFNSDKAFQTPI